MAFASFSKNLINHPAVFFLVIELVVEPEFSAIMPFPFEIVFYYGMGMNGRAKKLR